MCWSPENWFSVDEKEPVAHVLVEVVEASDVKPSDLNGQFGYYHGSYVFFGLKTFDVLVSGLADPYVKGKLGAYRFKTKIQKKTLSPIWREEFKIPIFTWDSPTILKIEVRDKDRFVDDTLGYVLEHRFRYSKTCVNINSFFCWVPVLLQ